MTIALLLCLQLQDAAYPRSLAEVRAMTQLLAPRGNADARETFLARMRQYRFLCGVPYEGLAWDADYADLARHASLACSLLDTLTHTPSRPAGMSDEAYEKARKGAGSSNLYAGQVEPAACVDGWMDDSDPKNIDRVGHRRWILNPAMGRSAFGSHGRYAAMYAFDASNRDVPDWDLVAYPPRGYMPTSFFGARHAWSVSLNMAKFAKPDPARVKVSIHALHPAQRTPLGPPLKLDYQRVDLGGYGSGPCVIFRPAQLVLSNDSVYQVEIQGVAETAIRYVVHFVAPRKAAGPEAAAVYTAHFKSRFAANQALEDKVDQLEGLAELLESEFAPHVEAAALSAMKKRMAELLKEPALKKEFDAAQRHRRIAAAERGAGQSKTQLAQAALAYRELASRYKDTRAGLRAAADFERLKARLD